MLRGSYFPSFLSLCLSDLCLVRSIWSHQTKVKIRSVENILSPRHSLRRDTTLLLLHSHAVRVCVWVIFIRHATHNHATHTLGLRNRTILVSHKQRLQVDNFFSKLRDGSGKRVVLSAVNLHLGLQIRQPLLLALSAFQSSNPKNICQSPCRDSCEKRLSQNFNHTYFVPRSSFASLLQSFSCRSHHVAASSFRPPLQSRVGQGEGRHWRCHYCPWPSY